MPIISIFFLRRKTGTIFNYTALDLKINVHYVMFEEIRSQSRGPLSIYLRTPLGEVHGSSFKNL